MRALIKWFQTRKQQIKHDQYISGFDYAIGAIVRDEKTPLELDAEYARFEWDSFDIGMNDATEYAVQHNLVKDDRF